MTRLAGVIWKEGMHLSQHHFQAQRRYFENSIHFALSHLAFAPYGIGAAELDADAIVVERNFGGDMCRATIEKQVKLVGGPTPRIIDVTASRGKRIRAEPVAMLYEQHRVWHLPGLEELEAEMTGWDASDGSPSPNRVDSAVWSLTWLMLTKPRGPVVW